MRKVWCTLSAFAAIGCGGPSLSPGGKAGADGGGEGQHVVHFGDECTPSEDAGTSTPDCHGGVVDNENECHARFELVKCYVAELDGGAPKCLPASDPAVVDLIRDDTWLYGFVPQNVIREDAQRVLPDGCEASIACCASLPDKPMSGQRSVSTTSKRARAATGSTRRSIAAFRIAMPAALFPANTACAAISPAVTSTRHD
jgi:hypothetical protein